MNEFSPLLKNKHFLYLWSSQIFSQITINIMNFLLLLSLFSRTESAIATSLLWVAYSLPAIFIGPFASATVDMIERRKILIITNLFQFLTIFAYAWLHQTQVFLIYGVAIVYSLLNQFYVPAEAASLPSLVKKNILPQANGLFFLTQQTSLVIGFGVAGILNQTFGFEKSLFICSFFIFLAFISVIFLPKMKVDEEIPKNFEGLIFKFFSRILEGYQYIKDHRKILLPFLFLIIMQVSLAIIMVNVPLIAIDILKINVNSAGLLVVVPSGIGAAVGAITVPMFLRKGIRKKTIVERSLILITLSFFLLEFLVPLISNSQRLIISSLLIVILGFAFIGALIPSLTFLQQNTPGGLRGRVFGNFWFLVTIATVFPVVFSGTISEVFGIEILLFLLQAMTLSIYIYAKKKGDNLIYD